MPTRAVVHQHGSDRASAEMTSDPRPRLQALGQQLVAVHDGLRADLAQLRTEVLTGSAPRALPAHCLAFCAALSRHHTSEDVRLFPVLEERHPELAEVLSKLREDHDVIASLLVAVEDAVAGLPAQPTEDELETFGQRVDGIGAIMESHFRFEERRLQSLLDTWPTSAGSAEQLLGASSTSPTTVHRGLG